MYNRLISLPKNKSFFLFGQRGTGKSTLLKKLYGDKALVLSLLDSRLFLTLTNASWKIRELVKGRNAEQKIIVIDEIQKLPILLDEVHKMIEEEGLQFILTGSSARKLKRQGTNLLAGRAYEYKLYPLSYQELGKDFDLNETLHWGALPQVATERDNADKSEFLYSYIDTYLREEIILEQVVRRLEPFSKFLQMAAQNNGDIVSYTNIAKDSGLSDVTIRNYFEILESTLIGFFLPVFHTSIRKRQRQSPKFYFHDLGVVRALTNQVNIGPLKQTYEYGTLFESFVINEFIKLNEYFRLRFKFSFIRVENDQEIDLVIEKPGGAVILVEIKSTQQIKEEHVRTLDLMQRSFKDARSYCLSQDGERKQIGSVLCVPWNEGIEEICR